MVNCQGQEYWTPGNSGEGKVYYNCSNGYKTKEEANERYFAWEYTGTISTIETICVAKWYQVFSPDPFSSNSRSGEAEPREIKFIETVSGGTETILSRWGDHPPGEERKHIPIDKTTRHYIENTRPLGIMSFREPSGFTLDLRSGIWRPDLPPYISNVPPEPYYEETTEVDGNTSVASHTNWLFRFGNRYFDLINWDTTEWDEYGTIADRRWFWLELTRKKTITLSWTDSVRRNPEFIDNTSSIAIYMAEATKGGDSQKILELNNTETWTGLVNKVKGDWQAFIKVGNEDLEFNKRYCKAFSISDRASNSYVYPSPIQVDGKDIYKEIKQRWQHGEPEKVPNYNRPPLSPASSNNPNGKPIKRLNINWNQQVKLGGENLPLSAAIWMGNVTALVEEITYNESGQETKRRGIKTKLNKLNLPDGARIEDIELISLNVSKA
jgi:hypothetical protein